MIVVELAGTPLGKGRPRFMRATGHAYTPERTRNFETNLRLAAQDAMNGEPPLQGQLYVNVEAYFPVPQSWSIKKKSAAALGMMQPTTRPDWENIAKMLDAFNTIVWRDDAQIVEGRIAKYYSDRPRLRVEVSELRVEK
jgi:Holliday junction resolvase RusA-like endonuclease